MTIFVDSQSPKKTDNVKQSDIGCDEEIQFLGAFKYDGKQTESDTVSQFVGGKSGKQDKGNTFEKSASAK